MKLRRRYGVRRWLPDIESGNRFLKIVSRNVARNGRAAFYDYAGRCLAVAEYERAGLFFCQIFIGKYPRPLSIIACPGEKTICSKECGDKFDILEEWASVEIE